jgi:ubiquinone/menaquinone biosynthesis C-methylase UbiE
MESAEETFRLDIKTNIQQVEKQALWAGLIPGMRVADMGCGSGKTTSTLNRLIQPGGEIVGADFSKDRIDYANTYYSSPGIEYICRDIRHPLGDLGMFDFIWVRFVLEYYFSNSFDIIKNLSSILKPGGILCLIDLDHNCLNHYSLSPRLEKTFSEMMRFLENQADFDPYAGRKLYSYLYDLGYQDIDVNLEAHHLIFGNLNQTDEFNWTQKVQVVNEKFGFQFNEYSGGYKEFFEEFKTFFSDPRRFSYTPVISCRGYKPMK